MVIRQLLRRNAYLKAIRRISVGQKPIYLEYDINMTPRWQEGNPYIKSIIEPSELIYRNNLAELASMEDFVLASQKNQAVSQNLNWHNSFLPVLDALALIHFVRRAPHRLIEVGSGNSTKFVKAALDFYDESKEIISIDPFPREEIDEICDQVIRQPIESVDLGLFDLLEPGDVVFIDNSHRSFMNSDVTVCMLEILPRLKSGVVVGVHDIFLPFDYFESWSERAYNEQYLLATMLLANPQYFDIQLPNYWICVNEMHHQPLHDIWQILSEKARERPASAFWGIKNHTNFLH